MSIKKTSVAIDEELLEEVQEALRTTTIRETIHEALTEVLRIRARRRVVSDLRNMEGLELDKSDVMRGAWRE